MSTKEAKDQVSVGGASRFVEASDVYPVHLDMEGLGSNEMQ